MGETTGTDAEIVKGFVSYSPWLYFLLVLHVPGLVCIVFKRIITGLM